VRTPAELLTFRREEWAAPGDGSNEETFQRWKDARRGYAVQHPDSDLGIVLDQLRFERRTRRLRAGWGRDGEAS
jgi:hypothetical protein